jgi:pimeloyl-ACP methyl ester carboxylesterase
VRNGVTLKHAARVTRHYCDGPFGQLHYRSSGQGPVVVFSHQAGSSSHAYEQVIRAFADQGYTAIAFDTPGAGLSDAALLEPSIEELSVAIDAIVHALGAETVVVVGHHTGGNIATAYALRNPDRTSALVISGPEAGFVYRNFQDSVPKSAAADGQHIRWAWERMTSFPHDGVSAEDLTRHFAFGLLSRDFGWHQNFATAKFDAAAAYVAVSVPTLVVCGAADPMHRYLPQTRQLRPDFTYTELPGVSSYVLDQDSTGWCEAILAFLRADLPQAGQT